MPSTNLKILYFSSNAVIKSTIVILVFSPFAKPYYSLRKFWWNTNVKILCPITFFLIVRYEKAIAFHKSDGMKVLGFFFIEAKRC